jgi:hypothetical protein
MVAREQIGTSNAADRIAQSLPPNSAGQEPFRLHPAVRGPGPAALDAWPVYRTYNDNGRRHYNKHDKESQLIKDVGVAPVRHSEASVNPASNIS